MVKITIDFDPNLQKAIEDFNLMSDSIMDVTGDAIEKTAIEMRDEIVLAMNQPYPQGIGSNRALKNSIEVSGEKNADSGSALFYVGTSLPYADTVEYGMGPHGSGTGDGSFIDSIIEWTERVLGKGKKDAYAIADHIRDNGIQPRPYFRKAVVKKAPEFKLIWSAMLAERLEAEFENLT